MTDYRAHGARTISHIETAEFTVAADNHDEARAKAEDYIAKHPFLWEAERDAGSGVSPLRWVISVDGVTGSGKGYMVESDRAERAAYIEVLPRAVAWLETCDEPAAALRLLDIFEEYETRQARENPWHDDDDGVLRAMFRDHRDEHRARLLKQIAKKERKL